MLSIQEMVDTTEKQRQQIRRVLSSGVFDPTEASIFNDQKPADFVALKESLHNLSLAELLMKSGSTGIAGAAYLVPDKLCDTLFFYSKETDKAPFISAAIVEKWDGGDLKVPIVNDATYKPHEFSGGAIPSETIETMLPTITPKSFGIAIPIGQDLIEDGQWDLVEFHTRQAAKAMGEYATSLALAVLNSASDGWGTLNGGASGDSQETKWMGATTTGISECIQQNLDDGWISNSIVTTGKAWTKSTSETLPAGSTYMPVKPGFTHCINNMDILLHTNAADIQTSATRHHTLVFDRNNALVTGRKRWMRIENYGNPIQDLFGAVVTGRQDSVSLYDDSVARIIETA